MEMTLTTPALLFPAITLLLLAYTNRFLALASLIRNLHERYTKDPDEILIGEIANLHRRVILIRNMQATGVLSIFFCVASMAAVFADRLIMAKWIFGCSLLIFMVSLSFSVTEIWISIRALNLHLSKLADFQKDRR